MLHHKTNKNMEMMFSSVEYMFTIIIKINITRLRRNKKNNHFNICTKYVNLFPDNALMILTVFALHSELSVYTCREFKFFINT